MATHGAYNLTATTTSMRFGTEALLKLVHRRMQEAPGVTRLFIDQSDWFTAHRETAGVTYDEMSEAARSGFEHHQNVTLDYGPGVVRQVVEGPAPLLALDVTIAWPDSGDAPSSFTYKDTLSAPHVEVHNSRVIRFKLVEYPDMVLYDEIERHLGQAARLPVGDLRGGGQAGPQAEPDRRLARSVAGDARAGEDPSRNLQDRAGGDRARRPGAREGSRGEARSRGIDGEAGAAGEAQVRRPFVLSLAALRGRTWEAVRRFASRLLQRIPQRLLRTWPGVFVRFCPESGLGFLQPSPGAATGTNGEFPGMITGSWLGRPAASNTQRRASIARPARSHLPR